jgi:hypothetical protein
MALNIEINQDKSSPNGNSFPDSFSHDDADIIVYDISVNKQTCLLLKKYVKKFYNNIYIPMNFFKMNKWNIDEVLADNVDALYFNDKYFTSHEKQIFETTFCKYITLIKNIFSPESNLFSLMNDRNVYFLKIISYRNYRYISPAYIADLYMECHDDKEKINELIEIVNDIAIEIKDLLQTFYMKFIDILDIYVYHYPLTNSYDVTTDTTDTDIYFHQQKFMNCLVLEILNLADILIKKKIYAIHPIVNSVLSLYFSLDIVNQHDPKENNHQELIII